jgi:dolichol kinase
MDQWALITIGAMLPSTFADTSSTIGGIYLGRHKWRYNPRKSIEGSIFNLFVAILVISLVAPYHLAILAGMGVMIVESLPHVDDNMNIPIVASFILSLGFIYF